MPACITHYQFALRVMSKLKKSGIKIPDADMVLIGAQGPDIFIFTAFAVEFGKSHADIGIKLPRQPRPPFEASGKY